jgi:hypothetical protein
MKTLQILAAELNMFKFDSIPNYILSDNYFADKYINHYRERFAIKQTPEEFKNLKNIETGYFVEVKEQFTNNTKDHELYYIEQEYFLVKHKDFNFICLVLEDCKTKRSYLHPFYTYVNKKMMGINYDQLKPFTSVLKEPNKFSVATDKNMIAWFNYCQDYLNAIDKALEQVTSKKQENEAEIKSFIDSLTDKKVSTWENKTTVETKNFYVEFEILNKGEYLSKKIAYKGGLNGIATIENK